MKLTDIIIKDVTVKDILFLILGVVIIAFFNFVGGSILIDNYENVTIIKHNVTTVQNLTYVDRNITIPCGKLECVNKCVQKYEESYVLGLIRQVKYYKQLAKGNIFVNVSDREKNLTSDLKECNRFVDRLGDTIKNR